MATTSNNGTVNNPTTKRGFWEKLKREIEPIINHAIVVLLLEATLWLIGLLAKGLEYLFPRQKEYFHYIETADIWICFVLLGEFGLYTLTLVGIRLQKSLKDALKGDD